MRARACTRYIAKFFTLSQGAYAAQSWRARRSRRCFGGGDGVGGGATNEKSRQHNRAELSIIVHALGARSQ